MKYISPLSIFDFIFRLLVHRFYSSITDFIHNRTVFWVNSNSSFNYELNQI
ncbi:hypothetical protein Hanom_Chr09g00823971 [Helianthus anomalus]